MNIGYLNMLAKYQLDILKYSWRDSWTKIQDGVSCEVTNCPGFSGTIPVWSGLSRFPKAAFRTQTCPGLVRVVPVGYRPLKCHCIVWTSTRHVCDELHHDRTYLWVIRLCVTLAYWRNNLYIARTGRFAKEVRNGMTTISTWTENSNFMTKSFSLLNWYQHSTMWNLLNTVCENLGL